MGIINTYLIGSLRDSNEKMYIECLECGCTPPKKKTKKKPQTLNNCKFENAHDDKLVIL